MILHCKTIYFNQTFIIFQQHGFILTQYQHIQISYLPTKIRQFHVIVLTTVLRWGVLGFLKVYITGKSLQIDMIVRLTQPLVQLDLMQANVSCQVSWVSIHRGTMLCICTLLMQPLSLTQCHHFRYRIVVLFTTT